VKPGEKKDLEKVATTPMNTDRVRIIPTERMKETLKTTNEIGKPYVLFVLMSKANEAMYS